MARHGTSIAKQSEGGVGEKYLPVGGWTGENVARSERSIKPISEERMSEIERTVGWTQGNDGWQH
jgi:hypothetical protein